jgi:hypothetical protein
MLDLHVLAEIIDLTCPVCDYKFQLAINCTNVRRLPAPGDPGLCTSCGALLCFKNDMTLRPLLPIEVSNLPEPLKSTLTNTRENIVKQNHH